MALAGICGGSIQASECQLFNVRFRCYCGCTYVSHGNRILLPMAVMWLTFWPNASPSGSLSAMVWCWTCNRNCDDRWQHWEGGKCYCPKHAIALLQSRLQEKDQEIVRLTQLLNATCGEAPSLKRRFHEITPEDSAVVPEIVMNES